MSRKWRQLRIEADENDPAKIFVFLLVKYNDRDNLVNVYHWAKEWRWKAPRGVNYREYKVDSFRADDDGEPLIRGRDWIEGRLNRGRRC